MAQPPRYRIHPAIGIARVGDASPDQFFLGPEQVNLLGGAGISGIGQTVPPYKVGGKILRQAQRFRIFEYVEANGTWKVSREITSDLKDVEELTWTVHLANRKAAFFEFDGLAGSPLLPAQPQRKRRNAAVTDRRTLMADPLPRSIRGVSARKVEFKKGTAPNPSSELWPNPAPSPALDYLGELRTDDRGRLIVIGGAALVTRRAGAPDIKQYANNDGWFDDVSDGPVTAVLRLRGESGSKPVDVKGAWVLVGPPDFAPDIPPTVTLWDVLVDLAVRELPIPADEAVYKPGGALERLTAMAKDLGRGALTFSTYKPSFDDDVAPILRQAVLPMWVFDPLKFFHTSMGADALTAAVWSGLSDPGQPNTARTAVFSRVRKPGTAGLDDHDMPRLLGDDPYNKFNTNRWGLSLTITQHAILEAWSRGSFVKSKLAASSLFTPALGGLSPDGMDRAAAQSCVGGAFYPGIEVGWQIRERELFLEPFRIKHGAPSKYVGESGTVVAAGHFSRQMALPWVADFLQCKQEKQKVTKAKWGWWPSQRPDGVYPSFDDARGKKTMALWHRASVGASSEWPSDAGSPLARDPRMPSYEQFRLNWTKLGFVVTRDGGPYYEAERAGAVP